MTRLYVVGLNMCVQLISHWCFSVCAPSLSLSLFLSAAPAPDVTRVFHLLILSPAQYPQFFFLTASVYPLKKGKGIRETYIYISFFCITRNNFFCFQSKIILPRTLLIRRHLTHTHNLYFF